MVSGSSLVSDPAQSVSYLIVGTLKVFDGHIIAGQGGDPSVA